jgi:serine/threonine protein kinase/tetratricopeptide (TPR) repeat protein
MPSREELLFAEALAQPEAERAAFLDRACAPDHALRARLENLLAFHRTPENLESPHPGPKLAEPPDEKAGTLIGRYKLLQKIGEGGCGIVWMAEQEVPVRRRVALKVIKLGMDTKAVVTRFEAERQALAMMDHPGIAKVLDGGATDTGRPFFVMELVRGTPITRFCDEANLPTNDRLRLFVQVCQAVQHAHQRGIIHRDLKPSNILVTMLDGAAVPKVIDFGIAKATQGRLTDATLFTAFEQFIGTPVYMSPEQAEMSSVEVDARSDIYSIGVLLYELLTGRPPFDPKTFAQAGVDQIRHQIRTIEPPRPSRRLQTLADAERTSVARLRGTAPAQLSLMLRGDLDWIVMRCLEKDRNRRYPTASALGDDIQRHLQHKPVTARPPSAPYLFRKFVRRNRVGLGAAVMCVTALVAGMIISRWQTTRDLDRLAAGSPRDTVPPLPSEPAPGATTSIAVLSFQNDGGLKEYETFSDGVSEDLINRLAQIPSLRVPGRTSAFYFKGKEVPLAEIARQLGVTYLVEGSVRRSNETVLIMVRLINASTGFQVWSKKFERALDSVQTLQDEIAGDIAENLQLKLGAAPRGAKTVNPEAHRLLWEGRHHWNLRNEEGFARAETAFERAIAIDPNFAEAHAGLAEACVLRANYRLFDGIGDTAADLKVAKREAQRAIELDAALPEPHAVLGFAAMLEGQLAESERHFQKALAMNPSSAVTHCWYALLLANRGKLDAALAAYAWASALDPLWFINLHRQAWHLARARRLTEAQQVNEQAASLLKDVHIPNRADHAVILFELGLKSEAVEAARQVTQRPDREPRWQADSDAIWVLRQSGFEVEAAEHAARLFAKWPASNFNRGFVLGALGRFEEALPFLEQMPATPARGLYWDRMWDQWRSDPRFEQLLAKLGRLDDYRVARATLERLTKKAGATKSEPAGRE